MRANKKRRRYERGARVAGLLEIVVSVGETEVRSVP
jgi:hypothetical protein